jgi:hypothetical protein
VETTREPAKHDKGDVEPPPPADPRLADRPDVRVATSRCPYCHEEVSPASADVCRDCLARHHGGCWGESKGCAACGSSHVLRPVRPPLTPELARELLAREGYPELEVDQVLGVPGTARCAMVGCDKRGVIQGSLGPQLHCLPHARDARNGVGIGGVLLLALAVVLVAIGLAITIAEEEPVILALGPIGLALAWAGGYLLSRLKKLPPLPPPTS